MKNCLGTTPNDRQRMICCIQSSLSSNSPHPFPSQNPKMLKMKSKMSRKSKLLPTPFRSHYTKNLATAQAALYQRNVYKNSTRYSMHHQLRKDLSSSGYFARKCCNNKWQRSPTVATSSGRATEQILAQSRRSIFGWSNRELKQIC